jgi:hypothetical protein
MAGLHVIKKTPTFVDLEAAAGRAEIRSHYQIGNDNVPCWHKKHIHQAGAPWKTT